ncbi:MAG: hypothetical protein ACK4PI_13480 [Tepidisphaerales bacterium]
MLPFRFPRRQVHLDFHTSEHIEAVGARFSKRQFQKALRLGNVNSITVFAKCHHSWSYYPTQVGRAHANLQRDLLGEMIEAAHELRVRAPIYYTIGWSANDAADHPEWVVKDLSGHPLGERFDVNAKPDMPRPECSWLYLDPTGDYLELMCRQVEEICQRYPVDGFFFDICHGPVSLAPHRLAAMREMGLSPDAPADLETFKVRTWHAAARRLREVILARYPDATVFFNGLAGLETAHAHFENQTHFELEDLPTAWGGYDKFPPRARYFHRFGKPLLAMSGKFHTSWGEFGGFKHRDAIRQEALAMSAFGAACSFGDQLHPSGLMDEATYANIGHAYKAVRQLEPLLDDATPAADLAIVHVEGDQVAGAHGRTVRQLQGVANMLLELQHDFRVVSPGDDLSGVTALVLPGPRFLDESAAAWLSAFLKRGGAVLALGESLLGPGTDRVMVDAGVNYLGPARYQIDYTLAAPSVRADLPASPFLNYVAMGRYVATKARTLASVFEPYFDRTYGHYCSHQNTPYRPEPAGHGGAFLHRNIAFVPTPLGACYHDVAARVHRQLFANLLRRVYPTPMVQVALPSGARVSLMHQPAQRRYVLHLLYATPLPRGRVQVLEDFPVFTDVEVKVRLPEPPASVTCGGKRLRFISRGGVTRFVLPRLQGHAAVVLSLRNRRRA